MTPIDAPTVLLIDDDLETLELFHRWLRREPYGVELAATAAATHKVLERASVAVVVADEHMPGVSGTELLAQIQLEHPDTVRMMLTGQGTLEVAVRAINDGQVYRFLTKPLRPPELAANIRDAIAEWRLRHTPATRRTLAEEARLEQRWNGLTRVERDASGAVLVPRCDTDLERVLREAADVPEIHPRRA